MGKTECYGKDRLGWIVHLQTQQALGDIPSEVPVSNIAEAFDGLVSCGAMKECSRHKGKFIISKQWHLAERNGLAGLKAGHHEK